MYLPPDVTVGPLQQSGVQQLREFKPVLVASQSKPPSQELDYPSPKSGDSCLCSSPHSGHLSDIERLATQTGDTSRPIWSGTEGVAEAYTIDQRPIWLRSAAPLGAERTTTCTEFPRKASGLFLPWIGRDAYPSHHSKSKYNRPAPGSGPRSKEGDRVLIARGGRERLEGVRPSPSLPRSRPGPLLLDGRETHGASLETRFPSKWADGGVLGPGGRRPSQFSRNPRA